MFLLPHFSSTADFAYFMLMEDEGLAKARDKNYETALHALAEKSCSPAISAHQLPKWFTKKLTTRAWSLSEFSKITYSFGLFLKSMSSMKLLNLFWL